MKICSANNSYESKTTLSVNKKNSNSVYFSGLKTPTTKCMFVFDLDGTLAHGTKAELSKIVEIAKQRSANLIYATGRNKTEVEKLQQKLFEAMKELSILNV